MTLHSSCNSSSSTYKHGHKCGYVCKEGYGTFRETTVAVETPVKVKAGNGSAAGSIKKPVVTGVGVPKPVGATTDVDLTCTGGKWQAASENPTTGHSCVKLQCNTFGVAVEAGLKCRSSASGPFTTVKKDPLFGDQCMR